MRVAMGAIRLGLRAVIPLLTAATLPLLTGARAQTCGWKISKCMSRQLTHETGSRVQVGLSAGSYCDR